MKVGAVASEVNVTASSNDPGTCEDRNVGRCRDQGLASWHSELLAVVMPSQLYRVSFALTCVYQCFTRFDATIPVKVETKEHNAIMQLSMWLRTQRVHYRV